MTISLLSAHGTPNTGSTWSCPLPAAIPANSWAYLLVINNNSGTTPVVTSPGWVLLDNQTSSGLGEWLYVKTVGPADSSTTINGTWSASVRWNTMVAVGCGENLDTFVWANTTSFTTSLTVPAITPFKNDCMDLILGGIYGNVNLGAVSGTPPSGFTEDQDSSSTVGTGDDIGVYLAHRQLTGQAGTAQTATTLTVTPSSRAGLWRFTLAPGSGLERFRDARMSTRVLIGPPQKLRDARLSMRVLATNPPTTGFDGWGISI